MEILKSGSYGVKSGGALYNSYVISTLGEILYKMQTCCFYKISHYRSR
jgi:hypothetical protein